VINLIVHVQLNIHTTCSLAFTDIAHNNPYIINFDNAMKIKMDIAHKIAEYHSCYLTSH